MADPDEATAGAGAVDAGAVDTGAVGAVLARAGCRAAPWANSCTGCGTSSDRGWRRRCGPPRTAAEPGPLRDRGRRSHGRFVQVFQDVSTVTGVGATI